MASRKSKWPKPGTPVVVYWLDAADHPPEWRDADDVRPMNVLIKSYGVFLGVQERNVMLAGTLCEADNHTHTLSQIPAGCVTKIFELQEIDNARKVVSSANAETQ
jgi:hypothetical protein